MVPSKKEHGSNGKNPEDKKMLEILSILKSGIDYSEDNLDNQVPRYISGQELSKRTKISRAAAWKAIRKLKSYGYKIESRQALGYRLVETTPLPVPWELANATTTKFIGKDVRYFDTAGSTQDIAIKIAEDEPGSNGTVVIARRQEGGRGRSGRKWVSMPGGLWMSVILKPTMAISKSTILPFAGAVAVCEAIIEKFRLDARLKWPNDVIISGNKVAGILLETSAEGPLINYAVMGIGVNINVKPDELEVSVDKSKGYFGITSIKNETGQDASILDFSKALIEKIEHYYTVMEQGDKGSRLIIERWRRLSATLGSRVTVKRDGKDLKGIAVDINADDGSLMVKIDSGRIETVVSGDVFLR